uniref:Secreted protein n=1 Tax=Acrobeloides nanus TaxID=290746 RepID=A0A914EI66_9BILA
MKSRKSLIRAILFVVRLQKSVAGHHGTALRRRNSNKRPKTPNSCGHSPLKRCDSTRIRGKVGQPKLLAQHRNSAPTTMFRASTPQIEIVVEPDGHHF